MRGYTVKQVAKLSGVSVRTLHHYDAVGLLKPDHIGENGYRYYGREELLRLQQIRFHRELGFPLEEIARVLDAPDFDRVEALKRHRQRLEAETRRYRKLVRTIDDTLAELEGDRSMNDKDLYKGFAPEKQAEYETYIADRFGQAELDASKPQMKGWSKADVQDLQAGWDEIEGGYAKALTNGLPADSEAVQALARRHAAWIARSWGRPPTAESFVGLSHLYRDHPDFHARYEARAEGLTEYVVEAMRAFAARELG